LNSFSLTQPNSNYSARYVLLLHAIQLFIFFTQVDIEN